MKSACNCIITALHLDIVISWDVTPYSLAVPGVSNVPASPVLKVYVCACPCALKMEKIESSKTLTAFCHKTRRHITVGSNIHRHHGTRI